MSKRVNRAFYSEPIMSFPGRLHITAEKSYIEVLMKEDDKRTFRTFPTEDYNSLINLLTEQDFYQDGFELTYKSELLEISKKAKQIREFLFKYAQKPSQEVYQREPTSAHKKGDKVKEQVTVPAEEPTVSNLKSDDKEIDAKVLLGNIVGSVVSYILSKKSSYESGKSSSENIALPEPQLFEQLEYDNVEFDLIDKNILPLTSKYIGKFANLHIPKKNGRYGIDKVVLLMSVISLYDGNNKNQGATIHCNNQLKELFESKWEKYSSNVPHDDIHETFLKMSDESFWHPNPPSSNGDFSALIDSGLAETLSQQKSRSLLRKTLYSRYLKLKYKYGSTENRTYASLDEDDVRQYQLFR